MLQVEEQRELRLKRNEEILQEIWLKQEMQHKDFRYSRGRSKGERSRQPVQRNNTWEIPSLEELELHVNEAKRTPNYKYEEI